MTLINVDLQPSSFICSESASCTMNVKNERKEISQSIELKELPFKYKGAYRPERKFIETILSEKVSY